MEILNLSSPAHHPECHPIPRMILARTEDRFILAVISGLVDHQHRGIGTIIDQYFWSINVFENLSFNRRDEM
jgi:hypothetical protein